MVSSDFDGFDPRGSFDIRPAQSPVSARSVAAADQPGFGRVFTDHMVTIRYAEGKGWYDARVEARAPDPDGPGDRRAALRAGDLRGPQGVPAPGRRRHAVPARRQRPARSATPPTGWRWRRCPRAVPRLASGNWSRSTGTGCPTDPEGSLYLRPFMYASEVFLGVRPSAEYLYVLIASPVGSYFKGGVQPVSVWVSDDYTRAAPGGTGAAKCGGNYAASLVAQAGGDRARLRPGGVPRRGRASLRRRAGRHEHLLRVRRRHAGHAAADRHHPARHHPRLDHHAGPGGRATRSVERHDQLRGVARGRGERAPAGGLRLRHRRRGHPDRHRALGRW